MNVIKKFNTRSILLNDFEISQIGASVHHRSITLQNNHCLIRLPGRYKANLSCMERIIHIAFVALQFIAIIPIIIYFASKQYRTSICDLFNGTQTVENIDFLNIKPQLSPNLRSAEANELALKRIHQLQEYIKTLRPSTVAPSQLYDIKELVKWDFIALSRFMQNENLGFPKAVGEVPTKEELEKKRLIYELQKNGVANASSQLKDLELERLRKLAQHAHIVTDHILSIEEIFSGEWDPLLSNYLQLSFCKNLIKTNKLRKEELNIALSDTQKKLLTLPIIQSFSSNEPEKFTSLFKNIKQFDELICEKLISYIEEIRSSIDVQHFLKEFSNLPVQKIHFFFHPLINTLYKNRLISFSNIRDLNNRQLVIQKNSILALTEENNDAAILENLKVLLREKFISLDSLGSITIEEINSLYAKNDSPLIKLGIITPERLICYTQEQLDKLTILIPLLISKKTDRNDDSDDSNVAPPEGPQKPLIVEKILAGASFLDNFSPEDLKRLVKAKTLLIYEFLTPKQILQYNDEDIAFLNDIIAPKLLEYPWLIKNDILTIKQSLKYNKASLKKLLFYLDDLNMRIPLIERQATLNDYWGIISYYSENKIRDIFALFSLFLRDKEFKEKVQDKNFSRLKSLQYYQAYKILKVKAILGTITIEQCLDLPNQKIQAILANKYDLILELVYQHERVSLDMILSFELAFIEFLRDTPSIYILIVKGILQIQFLYFAWRRYYEEKGRILSPTPPAQALVLLEGYYCPLAIQVREDESQEEFQTRFEQFKETIHERYNRYLESEKSLTQAQVYEKLGSLLPA